MQARRDTLRGLTAEKLRGIHPGLWMDKYLPNQDEKGKSDQTHRQTHFREVAGLDVSPLYPQFYERWEETLKASGASCRKATTQGRLAIGLGDESVLENNITLHRTYGVPYIPGSALKGLASFYVINYLGSEWGKKTKAYKILFGDTKEAGYITFHDALYVPGTGHPGGPLHQDIVTVHHPEYYQGKGAPPADWDSPNMIGFLTATGSFMIALSGSEKWVDATFDILAYALLTLGIGAKTSAGYGRMTLEEKPVDPGEKALGSIKERLDALPDSQVAGSINNFYQEWKGMEVSPEWKKEIAQAILDKIEQANRTKKSKDKGWFKELLECAQS